MTKTAMNVRGVINVFGGQAKLYRKLCEAEIEISFRTIENWIKYGVIPMKRFIQLVELANASGLKLKLEDHIQSEQTAKLSRKHRKQPGHDTVPQGPERKVGSGTSGFNVERVLGGNGAT